jgi:WD40 repeat protein
VESRIDLRVEVGSYTTLAAHPNERNVLAIGGLNKEVEIIKFNDHSKPVPVFKTLGPIRSVTFSKTGRYLAIASEEPTAVLYDYDKKMFVKCRPGHSGSVCSVFFSPDERYICSTGTDGVLKVFRI